MKSDPFPRMFFGAVGVVVECASWRPFTPPKPSAKSLTVSACLTDLRHWPAPCGLTILTFRNPAAAVLRRGVSPSPGGGASSPDCSQPTI